mmetsp:Transcript_27481/g.45993  ORF Transcript_27481/g.45993 Transcript_27481/m.45993 type:complete len:298 (-) Transcript_27481:280-1173(-)|eukprot:CAMPEP_0198222068 /NCGR_PEP_ID=MMETSP1445-20131203/86418_1 /TAXON_ID=36898 /ORGANISM="Pyramimonas sp., Strain CCMP2087" /LENGTH=297 /DNA_ID=CAMNT_0043900429 /DNA_START=191 /DNA_END=1084 /DNA_ORIENTATION=+
MSFPLAWAPASPRAQLSPRTSRSPCPPARSPKVYTAVPEGLPKGLDHFLRKRKATFLTSAGDNTLGSPTKSQICDSSPRPVSDEATSPKRVKRRLYCSGKEGDVELLVFDSPTEKKKGASTIEVKPLSGRSYTPLFHTVPTNSEPEPQHAISGVNCATPDTAERRAATSCNKPEILLRLSPESSQDREMGDDFFEDWLKSRKQPLAKPSSLYTEAVAHTNTPTQECQTTTMQTLIVERDALQDKLNLLTGEALTRCDDEELQDLGQVMEKALASWHAERRRRAFNKRMMLRGNGREE